MSTVRGNLTVRAAATALKTVQPRHIGSVASFPTKKTVKPARIAPILEGIRWPSQAQRAAAAEYAANALPGLLKDLEAPPIDDAARARLERLIVWRGIEAVTLLIRAIIESEGNEGALTEFVIDGVADVMRARPDWPEQGLAWIEAFDRVSLLGTVERMRALKCFTVKDAPGFYRRSIQGQLRDILDPAPPPPPPKRVRLRRSKSQAVAA